VSIWEKHIKEFKDYSGTNELQCTTVITSFFVIRQPYLLNILDI